MHQVAAVAQSLKQVIKENEKGQLQEEFMDYCMSNHDWEMESTPNIDAYWHKVSQLQDNSGQLRYPLFSTLARAVLIILHGNTDVERCFTCNT
jgi:hypothetical protein